MKIVTSVLCFCFIAFLYPAPASSSDSIDEEVELLFVQDAKGYELVDNAIVLKEARPNVLYFTDRPERLAGYLSRAQAVRIAQKSFEEVPPNAALVIFDEDKVTEVVLLLKTAPIERGDDLIFNQYEILSGELPKAGGNCALFIDNLRARRPGNPKGVADPRGKKDPRGVADPRGLLDPRGPLDPR